MVIVTALQDVPPLPHVDRFTKPFHTAALLEAVERLHRSRAEAPPPR
jgi:hypothetical protein